MRLRCTVAYDGAKFCGWQSQEGGGSVQDVLEKAVTNIAGGPIRIHGAGRTDAGVHALGQCFHFDPPDHLEPTTWRRALNAQLPPEVRILKIVKASETFHSRFTASGKVYRYLVRNADVLPPHEYQRAWLVSLPLDGERLQSAAARFVGRHDFSAFCANRGGPPPNPVRTLRRCQIRRSGTLWTFEFEGEGFLYKMVRMLVGALIDVGRGRTNEEDIAERLSTGHPRWNRVAPADGLYLLRVLYPKRLPHPTNSRQSAGVTPSPAPSKAPSSN